MGLFQVPMSLLGERIGELTVIGSGTFGLAGGFLLLSLATSFPAILGALIFAKGTGAGQHGLSSSVLSKVFEDSGRRAAMGTFNFAGDLGKVTLPFLLALLISFMGWRPAVFTLSLGGIASGSRSMDSGPKNENQPSTTQDRGKAGCGRQPLGNQGSKRIFRPPHHRNHRHLNPNRIAHLSSFSSFTKRDSGPQIGFALTVLFAGGAAGKFACGFLAEWFGIIPMVVATEALTTAGILSLFVASGNVIWFLLPLVGVFLNGTSSVLYATVAEIISPSGRSRGYGLYYAITLTSGAIAPIIYGFVTDFLGLSFTIICTALMVLITIPLSRFLSKPTIPTT